MKNFNLLFIFILFSPLFLFAQSGAPDSTFGEFGKVLLPSSGFYYGGASVLLPDGKIIVFRSNAENPSVSQLILTKLLPDGDFDLAFGDQGSVIPNINFEEISITDAVLKSDGKIVAVGSVLTSNEIYNGFLVQFHEDGSIDEDFGNSGFRVLNFSGEETELLSIKLRPNGKIVLGGFLLDPNTELVTGCLAQFLENGTDDVSFGYNGVVKTNLTPGDEGFLSIDLQNDGKIIAAGAGFSTDDEAIDMLVARFRIDGSLDLSFADNGIFRFGKLDEEEVVYDVVVQTDQKITFSGFAFSNIISLGEISVFRLDSLGEFDDSFGNNGRVFKDIGSFEIARKLLIDSNGKILVAGTSEINPSIQETIFWVYRFNADGSVDENFGQLGRFISNPYDDYPEVSDLLLQPDGKIIVSLYKDEGIEVWRLQNDPILSSNEPVLTFSLKITPNPIYQNATLSWHLDKTSLVSCSIVDAKGHIKQRIFNNEKFVGGNHQKPLFVNENWAAGTYFLRFEVDGIVKSVVISKI
jgi:uncharacterized delta-60 repeat protein